MSTRRSGSPPCGLCPALRGLRRLCRARPVRICALAAAHDRGSLRTGASRSRLARCLIAAIAALDRCAAARARRLVDLVRAIRLDRPAALIYAAICRHVAAQARQASAHSFMMSPPLSHSAAQAAHMSAQTVHAPFVWPRLFAMHCKHSVQLAAHVWQSLAHVLRCQACADRGTRLRTKGTVVNNPKSGALHCFAAGLDLPWRPPGER